MTEIIDSTILNQIKQRPQKMAKIIVMSADAPKEAGYETDYDAIAERLYKMCREGRIEAAGDIQNWRFSEVWIPSASNSDESA